MGRMFEVRKATMFARWAKNSRAFGKIGKEIAIAVKTSGPDPDSNPRLRLAIKTARSLNMPKDTIEAAIKRASAKDSAQLSETNYEAYGPHGVAIFIETATDNPTRTVANVRATLSRGDGSLATTGALDFIFQRKGVFQIGEPAMDMDDFELEMIDHGLEELFQTEGGYIIYTKFEDFRDMQKALEEKNIEVKSAGIQRLPTTTVTLNEEQAADIEKLIAKLEDDDDVQNVYHTMKVEEENS